MLKKRSCTVGETKHVVSKKLNSWQNTTCYKQEATQLAKQNILFTRSYTVGKTKHVINKKLHSWQSKACYKQEVIHLAKQNML